MGLTGDTAVTGSTDATSDGARGADATAEQLTIALLGPVEARRDGRSLELGGPQQRAVIAHLALDVGRIVSADRLIDRLWGENLPRTPLGTLQSYVSRLRRSIEPDRRSGAPATVLVSEAPGYTLRISPDAIDVHRFRSWTDEARRLAAAGRAETALARFDAALDLWSGTALGAIGSSDHVAALVNRLEEEHLAAREDRLDVVLGLGGHATAVGELQTLVEEHPFRERLWSQLVLALYRSRRQAEALRAVSAARAVLVDQLGIDPGAELRDLERRILDQDPRLLAVPVPDAPVDAPAPIVAPVDVELVGRRAERGSVADAMRSAEVGRPTLVMVEGEPGIGKTTLVTSVEREAAAAGWSVATGRCVEPGLAPSLWPCLEIFRTMAEREPGISLRDLVEPETSAPRTPVELAERFVDALDTIGGRWLFVVEDAHWADRATLDVIRVVLDRLGARPVTVLMTHRPRELVPTSLLADAVGAWPGAAPRRITMSPLNADDVGRLIEITSGAPPSDEVVERVHARAGGSPLFVVELARLAGVDGRLDTAVVPEAIRDVVRSRLAVLPPETLRELELVAVFGERFDLATAMHASSCDPDDFLDALDPAIVSRIVVPDGHDFRFAHALVRDAVSATIAPLRRARLHDRLAEALRHVHGESLDVAEPIAHHRLEARPVGGALAASAAAARASDVARWRGALDQAEAWAEKAIEVLAGERRDADVDLAETIALEAVAAAAFRSDEAEERHRVASRIAALAERSDNDAMRALSLFLNWGEIDQVEDLTDVFEQTLLARALADETDSPYAAVLANYMAGSADLLLGRIDAAVDHLERSIAATGAIDPDTPPRHVPLPIVPLVAAVASAVQGNGDAARTHIHRRARAWMSERRMLDSAADVALAFGSATVEAFLGEPENALAILDDVDLVDAGGFILFERTAAEVVQGWALARLGDRSGLDAAIDALGRIERSVDRVLVPCLRTMVADTCVLLGDERGVPLAAQAVDEALRRGEVFWLSETRRVQAEADHRFGDGRCVEEFLDDAARLAAEHGAREVARRVADSRARLVPASRD